MRNRAFLILLAALLTVSLAAACTPRQRTAPPAPTQRPAPQQRIAEEPAPQAPPNMTPDRDPNEDVRRAGIIADKVDDLKGIKEATVIVSGSTAYIGVNMDGDIEGGMTEKLKNQVIDRAKKTDRMLTRVYVTADVDAVSRLRNYARDIKGGKPISGLAKEIQELFRRPAPTTR